MMRLLIVEDDEKTARALESGLQSEGFSVSLTRTGEEGFFLLSTQDFDLIVLDWMLPGRDGIEILKAARARGTKTPVLLRFLGAGIILREGINVHGLNTAATLWCSSMVGTFAGGGYSGPSLIAAGFVVLTNLLLRPLVRRLNTRMVLSMDVETYYSVELTCKSAEEAHIRSLLLHALSQAGLGLRSLDSEDIPDTSKVTVTARTLAAKRSDAALEQIVGRLSLEPHVSAATWQVDQTVPEA